MIWKNKTTARLCIFLQKRAVNPLVEVTGLEPTTSWSRTKRATKLRYTSLYSQRLILYNIYFFLASVLHLIFTFFKILRRAKIVAGF